MSKRKGDGGVYLIRTRKPNAVLGLPFIGRHNGYVGLTNSYYHRERQHLIGGGAYRVSQKDWADLAPKFYRICPLPNWRWLMHILETLFIWALCPVYNAKKQPFYNVRKISIRQAERQRWRRAKYGMGYRVAVTIGRYFVYAAVLGVAAWIWWVNR